MLVGLSFAAGIERFASVSEFPSSWSNEVGLTAPCARGHAEAYRGLYREEIARHDPMGAPHVKSPGVQCGRGRPILAPLPLFPV